MAGLLELQIIQHPPLPRVFGVCKSNSKRKRLAIGLDQVILLSTLLSLAAAVVVMVVEAAVALVATVVLFLVNLLAAAVPLSRLLL
jgi:hypothetical protein